MFSEGLDKDGIIKKTKYKSARAQGSSRRFKKPVKTWGRCETPPGQPDCLRLHNEARGNQESFVVRGGLQVMGGVLGERRHPPGPPLAVNTGQCGSRFPVTEQVGPLGIYAGKVRVQHGSGNISCEANFGCLCLQGHSSASSLHDMVQGSPGSCFRCSATQVGPCDLPVSSSASHHEGSSQSSSTADQSCDGLSSLVVSSVVAHAGGIVGGAASSSTLLSEGTPDAEFRSKASLLGAPGGSSHFESAFGMTHSASGLDADDLNFLSNHLSLVTQTGYGYVFKRFQNFCRSRGQDPFVCDPTIIVKYIRSLYDGGAAYSTVNHHRSCISKFHAGFGHLSVGSHPMISQAVKAVFRLRPPLPKYINTFDVSLVFTYIARLPTNEALTLKQLTFKTLFLLTSSTISRLSSMGRLGPQLLVYEVIMIKLAVTHVYSYFQDHCVLSLTSLEKQGRPGSVRGYLRIQRFNEDPLLCPVAALVEYDRQVLPVWVIKSSCIISLFRCPC